MRRVEDMTEPAPAQHLRELVGKLIVGPWKSSDVADEFARQYAELRDAAALELVEAKGTHRAELHKAALRRKRELHAWRNVAYELRRREKGGP